MRPDWRRLLTPPRAWPAPGPDEIEAVRLLVSGEREARDRSEQIRALNALVGGEVAALSALRPHTVSMIDARGGDHGLLDAVRAAVPHPDRNQTSVLASLDVQMRRWDAALETYDGLERTGPVTAMETFLAFQVARIDGRRDRLERFDPRGLQALADRFPEVAADRAARWLSLGKPGRFAREIDGLPGREAEGGALAALTRAVMRAERGDGALGARAQGRDFSRLMAVCSLRCSGGSAIQDFIEDHGVWGSAREYVALSGYMGVRSARLAPRPRVRAIEFARLHLLGLTVPISRSHSRILRQARADRAASLTPRLLEGVEAAITSERTILGVLDAMLLNTWTTYLEAFPGPLLLKKLFSQGQLELLADLPPMRCVMVWRDPRDMYVDQVARGFVAAGDIDGFITVFDIRVAALKAALSAASSAHRDLFVNVGFEAFVTDAGYRDALRARLGLDATDHAPTRFDPAASAANVGLWRTHCPPDEAQEIERRLKPYIDSAAVRLDDGAA